MHTLFSSLKKITRAHLFTAIACTAIFFISSCSHPYKETVSYAHSTIELKNIIHNRRSVYEGTFSCEMDPELVPPLKTQLLPYPVGMLSFFTQNIPPGPYYLYCPSTGCPILRECLNVVQVDDEGKVCAKIPFIRLEVTPQYAPLCVTIYAIPGFSSDWYLISKDKKHVYHSSFVYQPIIAYGSRGQSIEIQKKECGGNILEVVLKGFKPYEPLTITSVSEGEVLSFPFKLINEKGEALFGSMPQVIGKKKGKVKITVSSKDDSVTAEADWDSSTLYIAPKSRKNLLNDLKASLK